MVENFLELIDIDDIIHTDEYVNMVDISVDVDQSFLLSNGLVSHNSASSAFRKYRDPQIQGAFSLRGKFINAIDITNQKLVGNSEVVNLMGAVGLKLGQKIIRGTLRYGKVIMYVDADCLEENTMIYTKDGPKKICDITYDDMILSHNGHFKKVKNIISKDFLEYISIKVNGNTILCSENHKLVVLRDGEVCEIKASEIKYSDFFLLKDKN